MRNSVRRAVASPEHAAAHEYHKALLAKVREDIGEIKDAVGYECDRRRSMLVT